MKHGSSTAGEVKALQQALEDFEDHMYVTMRIPSDSQSGILQVINGGHSIKDRERSAYIKNLMTSIPLKLPGHNHVSGLTQMADPLTKPKEIDWFDKPHSII